jgi:hypothetical protein
MTASATLFFSGGANMKSLAIVILAGSLVTQPSSFEFTLSGTNFVRQVYGMPGRGNVPVSQSDYVKREKVYSYIEGIKDLTEGTDWCSTTPLKTPDLADDLAAAISVMDKKVRSGNAAPLIRKILHQRYPCKKGKA